MNSDSEKKNHKYLQSRNRDADAENKSIDSREGKGADEGKLRLTYRQLPKQLYL